MIFDSLKNKHYYRNNHLLYKALLYLETVTPDTLPSSTVVLDGDVMFANPVSLCSRPEVDCVYEAHKTYIDLHYILSGTEGIATAEISALTEKTAYDEDKDIAFYDGDADGLYYLKPGQFMVCMPTDAHKVGIMNGRPGDIRKMVVKLRVVR